MSLLCVPQIAFASCAAVLIVMMLPGFWLYRGFLRDLREQHRDEWERLGRPTVVYHRSWRARRELSRWIADGGFERLADPRFAATVRRYRAYTRLYGAVFAGLWILFALVVSLRWTTA